MAERRPEVAAAKHYDGDCKTGRGDEKARRRQPAGF
jgi:hypothetical protein